MVALFTWFANPIKKWLSVALLVLGIVGGIFLKGKRSGVNKERTRNEKELKKNVKVKTKIRQDVANDSTDNLNKRLRRWSKK